jgi:hypothetical protein
MFVSVVTGTFSRIRKETTLLAATIKANELMVDNSAYVPEDLKFFLGKDDEDDVIEISNEFAQIRTTARHITAHWIWKTMIPLTIITHLYLMSSDTYDATHEWKNICWFGNFACSIIFFVELGLNCFSCGTFARVWSRHKLQLTIVIISIVGLVTDRPIVKVLCAIRGFRLMKYFHTLEALLASCRSSFLPLLNICVFTTLIGLCFTVTGRYLIGKGMNHLTRSNFGNLSSASLTMFQVMVGDAWSDVMYNAMIAVTLNQEFTILSQLASGVFVVSWFFFSSLVLNNLYVAIILEFFDIQTTVDNISQPGIFAYWGSIVKSAWEDMYGASQAVAAASGLAEEEDKDKGECELL